MSTKINIGISEENRKKLAEGLSKLLADTYSLYLKTQNYHWNVTGPMFPSLHPMFEGQYGELAESVDQIAERIRSLGCKAPASFTEFLKLSSVRENIEVMKAERMVEDLVLGHEEVIKTARSLFEIVDHTHDEPTADMLTQRLQFHEKTAWMLRSILE
jgi:starvation-inducible DNA-binding protein